MLQFDDDLHRRRGLVCAGAFGAKRADLYFAGPGRVRGGTGASLEWDATHAVARVFECVEDQYGDGTHLEVSRGPASAAFDDLIEVDVVADGVHLLGELHLPCAGIHGPKSPVGNTSRSGR